MQVVFVSLILVFVGANVHIIVVLCGRFRPIFLFDLFLLFKSMDSSMMLHHSLSLFLSPLFLFVCVCVWKLSISTRVYVCYG